MRLALLVVPAVLCAPGAARAADLSPAQMQQLSAQPGVVVAHRPDGATTWTRNGVVIERDVKGSAATAFSYDTTGKGAVMCTLMVDVEIRAILDTCPSEPLGDLRHDLDDSIARINDFVVRNSLTPISLDALHAQEAADGAQAVAGVPRPPEPGKLCTEGATSLFVATLARMTREQRRKATDDLLSIPRWPVLNPCL